MIALIRSLMMPADAVLWYLDDDNAAAMPPSSVAKAMRERAEGLTVEALVGLTEKVYRIVSNPPSNAALRWHVKREGDDFAVKLFPIVNAPGGKA